MYLFLSINLDEVVYGWKNILSVCYSIYLAESSLIINLMSFRKSTKFLVVLFLCLLKLKISHFHHYLKSYPYSSVLLACTINCHDISWFRGAKQNPISSYFSPFKSISHSLYIYLSYCLDWKMEGEK